MRELDLPSRFHLEVVCIVFISYPQTIRFSFDGTRINESDTPKGLDMEDGDTIEVFQQQSGGGRGCDSGMKGRPRSSDRRGSTIQVT